MAYLAAKEIDDVEASDEKSPALVPAKVAKMQSQSLNITHLSQHRSHLAKRQLQLDGS